MDTCCSSPLTAFSLLSETPSCGNHKQIWAAQHTETLLNCACTCNTHIEWRCVLCTNCYPQKSMCMCQIQHMTISVHNGRVIGNNTIIFCAHHMSLVMYPHYVHRMCNKHDRCTKYLSPSLLKSVCQVLAVIFLRVVLLSFGLPSLPPVVTTSNQHIHYKPDNSQGQPHQEIHWAPRCFVRVKGHAINLRSRAYSKRYVTKFQSLFYTEIC